MSAKAKVMPNGRLSLPTEIRRRHGLAQGGEVIVEDTGDAIVLRTLDQVVARAQQATQRMLAKRQGTTVDDFIAERRGDEAAE